jgi:hypothetical protein
MSDFPPGENDFPPERRRFPLGQNEFAPGQNGFALERNRFAPGQNRPDSWEKRQQLAVLLGFLQKMPADTPRYAAPAVDWNPDQGFSSGGAGGLWLKMLA